MKQETYSKSTRSSSKQESNSCHEKRISNVLPNNLRCCYLRMYKSSRVLAIQVNCKPTATPARLAASCRNPPPPLPAPPLPLSPALPSAESRTSHISKKKAFLHPVPSYLSRTKFLSLNNSHTWSRSRDAFFYVSLSTMITQRLSRLVQAS